MSELMKAYEAYKKEKMYDKAFECVKWLYKDGDYKVVQDFRIKMGQVNKSEKTLRLARSSYFLTAQDNFDDYMIALEWDRPYKEKFYLPRRNQLKPIVHQMQRLGEKKLEILGVSAPPGVGKTGLGDFFLTWLAGRDPLKAMLMGSHSTSILNDNYNECLRILTSEEYCWQEIFKGHSVVKTNAADLKIDVDKPQKFSTLQYSSMESKLAGKIRAIQLIYLDDLISSAEEAMSRERLDKIWIKMNTDYMQRMQGDECGLLLIMTRWSLYDPIGRLQEIHESNPKAKFVNIPALNEEGKSNFDYGGSIGFSTKFYLDLKKSMDDVMFNAIYMGQPIEREGMLYPGDSLRYYYDLPEEEPDAVISVVDTKDQGKDDCVMPVAYVYGNDYYIEDFVCTSALPDITTPLLVSKLKEHKVKMCRFESNSAGGGQARDVRRLLKEQNGITTITTKYSTANKETRIIMDSGWVKEHCLFKDETVRNLDYRRAMNKLCSYATASKNKTDDVPDAMSMLANFAQGFETNVITVRQRFF